ncbi:GNAT family N-acetyltransferase [Aestuariivirga sp.]|uniref:GNAT family N-acetyltransferase n=1 Tax=Aestuariivirga sp. TaxID=2650926 RepID=UPI003593906B
MTVIATPRLVLRAPEVGDIPDIVRGLNNFAVSQWTSSIPFPYGEGDARAFLRLTSEAGAELLRLAITIEDQLIGVVSIEENEIGYWLAEAFWGKGFGREAARAITDIHFANPTVQSLAANYGIGNAASRRILLGLGFVETVPGREFSAAHNAEVDVMCLTLTREDWKSAKERRR